MKNILVPVDFSPVSRHTLTVALRLARLTGGRVYLQHIVPIPIYPADIYGAMMDTTVMMAESARSARRRLARMAARHADTVRILPVETGVAAASILARARQLRASFIVLGSHGHGLAYDLVVGSVAQTVLRRATCPVLVVPTPGSRPRQRAA